MGKNIVVIQGHPDARPERFCSALAQAYAAGGRQAGHTVEIIEVGTLEFPLLRSRDDWEHTPLPAVLAPAQAAIGRAQHVVIVFPLWLGALPALLKGFLEQVLRPGFAFGGDGLGKPALGGRSARIVVTMGMPALLYRWYFRAHSIRSLERNILRFVGIKPVRETVIGMVEGKDPAVRERWLAKMRALGAAAR